MSHWRLLLVSFALMLATKSTFSTSLPQSLSSNSMEKNLESIPHMKVYLVKGLQLIVRRLVLMVIVLNVQNTRRNQCWTNLEREKRFILRKLLIRLKVDLSVLIGRSFWRQQDRVNSIICSFMMDFRLRLLISDCLHKYLEIFLLKVKHI